MQEVAGAVTLTQHFGSAANLDTRLHFLVLDDVYRFGDEDEPLLIEAVASTDEELQAVQHMIVTRTIKQPARREVPIEEQGQTRRADNDAEPNDARWLRPLQAPDLSTIKITIALDVRAPARILAHG